MVLPSLVAVDLDGTLLSSDKQLSSVNRDALVDMHNRGVVVLFASGRIGSSMLRYADQLPFDVAMLTLNGAAVYPGRCDTTKPLYSATVPRHLADDLLAFSSGRSFALNYYRDGRLFTAIDPALRSWTDLYVAQTGSCYEFVPSLASLAGGEPSKLLMVGSAKMLDELHEECSERYGRELYIVRTWDYYLEFMNPKATKGLGVAFFAESRGLDLSRAVGFGDADNDVPLLSVCGTGIAPRNASAGAQKAARIVSMWSNDEDFVAREWEKMLAG